MIITMVTLYRWLVNLGNYSQQMFASSTVSHDNDTNDKPDFDVQVYLEYNTDVYYSQP